MGDGNGMASMIGVGVGVTWQLMAKVSAFAEGGIGPGKCIPHHTKSVVNRAVMLLVIMSLKVIFVLSVFMFGVGCEKKFVDQMVPLPSSPMIP